MKHTTSLKVPNESKFQVEKIRKSTESKKITPDKTKSNALANIENIADKIINSVTVKRRECFIDMAQ